MKNIVKIGYLVLSFSLFIGAFTACNDKDEDLGDAPRLFRPIAETEAVNKSIKVKWDLMQGVDHYLIETSRDSFATIDHSYEATASPLIIEDVDWDTQYQVRIKSMGTTLESSYYVCEDVTVPDYPTLMQNIVSTEILDNAVIVRWINNEVPFTTLKFYVSGEVVKEVALTAADIEKKYVEVYGLTPSTSYVVMIFSDDVYRGKKKFTTIAAQNFTNPVDLRNLDDAIAKDTIKTSFLDAIADGSTVVLKGGLSYNIATTNISKSVKFVTGTSFSGRAKMVMTGNFNFSAGVSVGNVDFENIDFVTGGDKTSANYGGKYVFNINPATASTVTGAITFENCSMKYLRGVLRAQSNISIEHMKVNNCVLDSIGGYGIMNCDNANSAIKNMTLTNSTVAHADKVLVNSKSATPGSILVDGVTFCWTPVGPGNYFLDFGTGFTISGSVTVSNCIFGPVNVTSTAQTANGYRGICSSVNFSGNYRTSEFAWTLKVDGVTENAPIDATAYGKVYTNLWTNPTTLNFLIKDSSFAGRMTAGDPRWRLSK